MSFQNSMLSVGCYQWYPSSWGNAEQHL